MRKRTRIAIATGAALAGISAAGAGLAIAGGAPDDNETETPITGEALQRASAVAIAHTGGGTVTATEVGDEESYYEVEVTLGSGKEVDVQLDKDFTVVGSEADDGAEAEDGTDD